MAILSTGLEKLSHFALAPTAERTSNLDGTAVDLNDYEGDVVVMEDLIDTTRYSWRAGRNPVRLDPVQRWAHVLRVVRRPSLLL